MGDVGVPRGVLFLELLWILCVACTSESERGGLADMEWAQPDGQVVSGQCGFLGINCLHGACRYLEVLAPIYLRPVAPIGARVWQLWVRVEVHLADLINALIVPLHPPCDPMSPGSWRAVQGHSQSQVLRTNLRILFPDYCDKVP